MKAKDWSVRSRVWRGRAAVLAGAQRYGYFSARFLQWRNN